MNIEYTKGGAIIEMPDVAFTYQVAETPRDFDRSSNSGNTLQWQNIHNYIGDYLIYPYGSNNDLPKIIKDVIDNSYNVPGFLSRKTELLWGAGPKLYRDDLEDNKDVRTRVNDVVINKWLQSIKYEDYLLKCCVDYQHMQGVYTRFETNKGSRINQGKFVKLHHIPLSHGRLARLKDSKSNDPTHLVTSTFQFQHINAIADRKAYPLFDYEKPFEFDNSVLYSNMYSFCSDYYNVPQIYGSLEWINRSTAVPLIFKAYAKNSINLKYHIISPGSFWDNKRKAMQADCVERKITYSESMMVEYEKNFLKQIGLVLASSENVGKYLHTPTSILVKGHELISEGWEIKVLDQKVKDFVESQILISDKADKAIAAGVNVHPVLANMTDSGKANSGSEQIYALLNYLNTGVDIQEMIICKALNYAISANFPDSGLKVGFFHNAPEMQANTSPADRTKNPNA
jgi:hypothetical protein